MEFGLYSLPPGQTSEFHTTLSCSALNLLLHQVLPPKDRCTKHQNYKCQFTGLGWMERKREEIYDLLVKI